MAGIRKWFDNQTGFSMVVPNNNQARLVESDLLHTEKILSDRKTFFLDLKQNNRGMVVKITEDVGGNRDTIMVPAEILGDFIAALSDIKLTADEHQ
jgi:hypothetical protein